MWSCRLCAGLRDAALLSLSCDVYGGGWLKVSQISFRCRNTIAQLIKPATDRNIPPHNKGGVYQLTCKTCNLSYVGQTSQNLKTHFQEHIRYIKTNNPQSVYAQHILHNRHKYGTLNELMTLLKPLQHESMLLPYEQYHIQQCPGDPNPLFQLALNRPHPYTPQDRDSRAASRKLDTQPTAPHL